MQANVSTASVATWLLYEAMLPVRSPLLRRQDENSPGERCCRFVMTVTKGVLLRRHCHFPDVVLALVSFDPCNASALHAARLAVSAISVEPLPRSLAKKQRAVGCKRQRELEE